MPEAKPRERIKLPPKVATELQDLRGTVAQARHDISVMKKLGMDTKMLEDKLDWAEKARETMLKEFT